MKTIETIFKMLDLQLFAALSGQPQTGTYGVSNVNTTLDDGVHNITGTNDLSPGMKTFYDTELLQNARANLVFNQFGKKQPLSQRQGDKVQWRRYKSFAKALTPLAEGEIPVGHKMDASQIIADLKQYGDYVPISDKLEYTDVDPIIAEAVKENGAQAGATLDTLTRDVVCTGTKLLFSSGIDNPLTVGYTTSGDKITAALVAKAATLLKKSNTPTINGKYYAIIHPSVAHDLRQDSGWLSAHEYAQPGEIFNGEIGELHGVRFVESTEAKIEYTEFVVSADAASAATSVTVTGVTGADFTGKSISAAAYNPTTDAKICDVTITASSASTSTTTLTVSALSAAVAKDSIIRVGKVVYNTVFFGADAWGVVEPNGASLESIVKDKSYGGPLNQFSTVGWKAMHASAILYEERMVNLISGSSFADVDDPN